MTEDKVISKDKLEELCMKFDEYHKSYPEHTYEGVAVLEYIFHELGWNKDKYLDVEEEWDREYYRYKKFKYIWKDYGD